MEVGLAQGKQLPVDGSLVEANAAKESRIPRISQLNARTADSSRDCTSHRPRALFFGRAVSISHSQLKNDYVAATKANNAYGRRFGAIFYWQPIKFMSGAGVLDPGLTESGGV